jgi:hypothetical protein
MKMSGNQFPHAAIASPTYKTFPLIPENSSKFHL